MTKYFISESTGRMRAREILTWRFPEFDYKFRVHVQRTEKPIYISFKWENKGEQMLVEINLEIASKYKTVVRISEKSKKLSDAGINWLKSSTEGWTYFLSCLKAYLEYSVNLRKDAFDYRFT
jgi:uncharacterized protein YndB with AHSA1/START domain